MPEVLEPPIRKLDPSEYAPQVQPVQPKPAVPLATTPTPGVEHREKPPATTFTEAFNKARAAKPAPKAEQPKVAQPAVELKKPDAVVPEPTEEQPKDSAGWKKFHARVKESETKLANLGKELEAKVAEIETLKKQPQIDPKELETLKTEKSAMMERLEKVALADEPLFQARYDKPIEQAIADAKAAVGSEYAATIEDLLQTPNSKARKEQLGAILSEIDNEFDRGALTQAVLALDKARTERKDALSKSKENLAELRKVQTAKQAERTAEQQKIVETQVSNAIAHALKFGEKLSAFTKVEGGEAHNAKIQARMDWVRNAFSGKLSPEELMEMPALAAEAKHLREDVLPVLIAQNKQYETTLAQLTTADPSLTTKAKADGVQAKAWEPGTDSPFIASYKRSMARK